MVIELTPEIEAVVRGDVAGGAYASPDEFVASAVLMLHERETWLRDNRAEIDDAIGEGIASSERGELLDPDQVVTFMADHKRAWREAAARP